MPEPKDIPIETPSSSGESDKVNGKEPCQRKRRKLLPKHGSAHTLSQIPRASSTHRLETAAQQPSGDNNNKLKESSKSLVPYRIRKSLSQMDMMPSKKNSSNNNNGSYSRYHPRSNFQESFKSIILPKPMLVQDSRPTSRDVFYHPTKDSLMYLVSEPESGGLSAKAAGMKIFATIMLNAWRRRRDDVRRLNDEVDQLQKRSIKVKNQIHVLNSVFRNEQKQNEKLSRQLRHATEDYQRMQQSVESLTTSLISAKAEASLYEQQLHAKEQENDTLNNILTETNSQLFKSMTQIRHLQTSLSCEQRNVQQLENQKNELLNELTVNQIKYKKEEEQHLIKVFQKEEELSKATSEIKMLETLLQDLKDKEFQVRDLRKSDSRLRTEIETLRSEIKCLKVELDKSFTARMKHIWRSYMDLHHNTLMMIHLGAFYLLPAIPPPKTIKIPVCVSFDKVMSAIRD